MVKADIVTELAKFIQKTMKAAGVSLLVITPQMIVQAPTEAGEENNSRVVD